MVIPNDAQESRDQFTEPEKIPVFGARKKAAELAQRLATSEAALAELGALDMLELQGRRAQLEEEVQQLD